MEDKIIRKVTTVRDPLTMTPEEVAAALESIPILEHWIKSVKAYAFELARAGETVPGWKMGYGVRKRIWKPGQEEAVVRALVALGVDKADLYTKPELISPPKVETHLKFLKKWPAKPRGGDRPATPIDPYVEKSMPEPSLVRANEDDEPDIRRVEASEEFK